MNVLQIKVSIDRIKPAIWRRLIVKSSTTLYDLHHIIQIAFGWENYHIYSFSRDEIFYGDSRLWGEDYDFKLIEAKNIKIDSLLTKEKTKLRYEYDMGDGWIHTIKLEKNIESSEKLSLPLCTKGERCGPPEDCGGVGGYYLLLESLESPDSKQYRELVEWMGYEFDPEYFNIEDVNNNLSKIQKAIREYENGFMKS